MPPSLHIGSPINNSIVCVCLYVSMLLSFSFSLARRYITCVLLFVFSSLPTSLSNVSVMNVILDKSTRQRKPRKRNARVVLLHFDRVPHTRIEFNSFFFILLL